MNDDGLNELLSDTWSEFSQLMDEFDFAEFENSLSSDIDLMACSGDLGLLYTKVQLDM